jgi:hypothetical protein
LQSVAGNGQWFAEFRPVNFLGLNFVPPIGVFLMLSFAVITGAYPTYLAGFQTSFAGVCMFIALKEHPFLKLIFQIDEEPQQTFDIGPFHFILIADVEDMDVCRYHVTLGDDTMVMTFIGIDASIPCLPYSMSI